MAHVFFGRPSKVFLLIAFCCVVIWIAGCSTLPPTLITSTSPLPPGVRGTLPTYGSNCQFYFLGLIPITSTPDTQDALEDAKLRVDVDVLTDVTIDYGGGYFILFSNNCVRIRGKGVPRDVLDSALGKVAPEVTANPTPFPSPWLPTAPTPSPKYRERQLH